ncbi:MAG: transcription termination/antitermination NusG family protein [Clostridium fessum]
MAEANWYVVHTYSGYENKVKANIEKDHRETDTLQDQILEVSVSDAGSCGSQERSQVNRLPRKMFPGYVLINMVMNDDTLVCSTQHPRRDRIRWSGSKPVPLTEEEMSRSRV